MKNNEIIMNKVAAVINHFNLVSRAYFEAQNLENKLDDSVYEDLYDMRCRLQNTIESLMDKKIISTEAGFLPSKSGQYIGYTYVYVYPVKRRLWFK